MNERRQVPRRRLAIDPKERFLWRYSRIILRSGLDNHHQVTLIKDFSHLPRPLSPFSSREKKEKKSREWPIRCSI
jgi:hypothetical protein